jgi:hypothetical protein
VTLSTLNSFFYPGRKADFPDNPAVIPLQRRENGRPFPGKLRHTTQQNGIKQKGMTKPVTPFNKTAQYRTDLMNQPGRPDPGTLNFQKIQASGTTI